MRIHMYIRKVAMGSLGIHTHNGRSIRPQTGIPRILTVHTSEPGHVHVDAAVVALRDIRGHHRGQRPYIGAGEAVDGVARHDGTQGVDGRGDAGIVMVVQVNTA